MSSFAQEIPLSGGAFVGWDGTNLRLTQPGGPSNAIPSVLAKSNLLANSAAVAAVLAYTPAAAGIFRVEGYLTITAISVDVIALLVSYTDENSNSQTQTLYTSPVTPATGAGSGSVIINAAAGSAITVATVLTTGGGSITYDVGARISQI